MYFICFSRCLNILFLLLPLVYLAYKQFPSSVPAILALQTKYYKLQVKKKKIFHNTTLLLSYCDC